MGYYFPFSSVLAEYFIIDIIIDGHTRDSLVSLAISYFLRTRVSILLDVSNASRFLRRVKILINEELDENVYSRSARNKN